MNTTEKDMPIETEDEETTYFNSQRVLRIGTACEAISILFLILAVLIFLFGAWLLIQAPATSASFERFLAQVAPLVLLLVFFILLCLFFWVFLRALSEGLFILMDIQDNTSRTDVKSL